MLIAEGEGPDNWWKLFCQDYRHFLYLDPLAAFRRLSEGIELFQPNFFRADPAYLNIWLAYLECHLYDPCLRSLS